MIESVLISFLLALLFSAALPLLCGGRARLRQAVLALLPVILAGGAGVAGWAFWGGVAPSVDLSSFAPLPFALTLDRLSAFFLLLICGVGAPVALYSLSYVERHYEGARRGWLWSLLPLFLFSMVLVVTASTAFAFLVGWELMTLLSAALIVLEGDSESRRHSLFLYLLMMHAGASAVIAGYLLFLPAGGRLDFAAIRAAALLLPQGTRTAIFVFSFVGFGIKAGVVPFHLWLPKAHPIAPSPVSALMSAVMLKTAVYGLIRFTFDFLGSLPAWCGYLVLAIGGLTALLGILYALAEHDIKRLLAYSSVENLGIIHLGIGAAMVLQGCHAGALAALALLAALLHAINHSLFKSTLFLGAGAIKEAAQTLDLEELGGLFRRMRGTATIFLIACCSIAGLPLGNGFVSEWLLFRSLLGASALSDVTAAIALPLTIGVLALTGGVALACFAKLYGVAFLGRPRSQKAAGAVDVPSAMRWAMALPAAGCLLTGILPGLLLQPLGALTQELLHAPVPQEVTAPLCTLLPWLAGAMLLLTVTVTMLPRPRRVTRTWGCGLPELDGRMQYSSTAFSKPLRKAFPRVYKAERQVETVYEQAPYFASSVSYKAQRTTSFERSLYKPATTAVVNAARRLRLLQTGNIQFYLLYIFLALVALLLFARFA